MSPTPDEMRDLERELRRLRADEGEEYNEVEELSIEIDNLINDITDMLDDPKLAEANKETAKMARAIIFSDVVGSTKTITNSFKNLNNRLSIFSLGMEALEPVFDVINGVFSMFVGYIKEGTSDSIAQLTNVLTSDGLITAMQTMGTFFGTIIDDVIINFADGLQVIFGDTSKMTSEEVGRGIGAIIGGVIGLAIGVYIGQPTLGAVAGLWIGGIIGGAIGGIIPEGETDIERHKPPSRRLIPEAEVGSGFISNPPERVKELETITRQPLSGKIIGIESFAEGGIVTSSTFANIGEAGPEAVIPLDRLKEFTGGNLSIYTEISELIDANNILLRNNRREKGVIL